MGIAESKPRAGSGRPGDRAASPEARWSASRSRDARRARSRRTRRTRKSRRLSGSSRRTRASQTREAAAARLALGRRDEPPRQPFAAERGAHREPAAIEATVALGPQKQGDEIAAPPTGRNPHRPRSRPRCSRWSPSGPRTAGGSRPAGPRRRPGSRPPRLRRRRGTSGRSVRSDVKGSLLRDTGAAVVIAR